MEKDRGSLHSPGQVHQIAFWDGVRYPDNDWILDAEPLVGRYEYIDSVYEGRFTPKVFRVNPVTVYNTTSGSKPGISEVVSSGRSGYQWEGHVLCHSAVNAFCQVEMKAWDKNLERYSLNKLYAKLNSPDADLAVMLGELRQTLELLLHPFKSLDTFLNNFHSSRRFLRTYKGGVYFTGTHFLNYLKHNGANVVRFSADTWLQWRYGVQPLYNDIKSIIKLFTDKVRKLLGKLYRRRAEVEVVTRDSTDLNVYWANLTIKARATKHDRFKSSSVIYYERLLQSGMDLFNRAMGFDLSQAPAAAWEVTKFSFVVDWFIRVGEWLQAIMPNMSILVKGGCTSQTLESEIRVTVLSTASSNIKVGWKEDPEFTWVARQLIRHVDTSKPVIPALNPNFLNYKRVLDTLALAFRPINKRFIRG